MKHSGGKSALQLYLAGTEGGVPVREEESFAVLVPQDHMRQAGDAIAPRFFVRAAQDSFVRRLQVLHCDIIAEPGTVQGGSLL